MVDKTLIDALLKHTHDNEIEILQSKTCTCLFCRHTLDARSVGDWVDTEQGVSAVCPECGMASLIGDASGYLFDRDSLREINQAIYGEDYMEKHPEAAETYIKRYRSGAITHKASNERLYVHYLSMLGDHDDVDALYLLGEHYRFGSEFSLPDLNMAFTVYSGLAAKNDAFALTYLGLVLSDKRYEHYDEEGAYRCFAKATALASDVGAMHLADCYMDGIAVKEDHAFARLVYETLYARSNVLFRFTAGEENAVHGALCFRLGQMAYLGLAQEKNERHALRFFLLARLALGRLKEQGQTDPEEEEMLAQANDNINQIASFYALDGGVPVFDRDTFDDTMCVVSPSPEYDLFPTNLENIVFNEAEGVLEFDMVSKRQLLTVDTGKLYAGFTPERIHWVFEDVASVHVGKGKTFSRIVGDPDEGYRFLTPAHYNNAVLEVRFAKDEREGEEESLKKEAGVNEA